MLFYTLTVIFIMRIIYKIMGAYMYLYTRIYMGKRKRDTSYQRRLRTRAARNYNVRARGTQCADSSREPHTHVRARVINSDMIVLRAEGEQNECIAGDSLLSNLSCDRVQQKKKKNGLFLGKRFFFFVALRKERFFCLKIKFCFLKKQKCFSICNAVADT